MEGGLTKEGQIIPKSRDRSGTCIQSPHSSLGFRYTEHTVHMHTCIVISYHVVFLFVALGLRYNGLPRTLDLKLTKSRVSISTCLIQSLPFNVVLSDSQNGSQSTLNFMKPFVNSTINMHDILKSQAFKRPSDF